MVCGQLRGTQLISLSAIEIIEISEDHRKLNEKPLIQRILITVYNKVKYRKGVSGKFDKYR